MFQAIVNEEDEEDDDLFGISDMSQKSSSSKTKLANLFESNGPISESSKSSLFYKPKAIVSKATVSSTNSSSTAQNSTTKTNHNTTNKSSLNLFCVAAVDVHKFENDKYSYAGKFGMAVLGNDQEYSYRLILYTGKQKPFCQATIGERFKFLCQKDNYANFYDDNLQNWSVRFTKPDHEEQRQFCLNIAHCRYGSAFAARNSTALCISQDLCHLGQSGPSEPKSNTKLNLIVRLFRPNQSLFQNSNSPIFHEITNLTNFWDNHLTQALRIPGDSRLILCSQRYFTENHDLFSKIFPSDIVRIIETKENVWKIGLEFSVIEVDEEELRPEKQEINQEEEVPEILDDPVVPLNKSNDLASRMAKMGAKPVFNITMSPPVAETKPEPIVAQSPPKPQPRQNISNKISEPLQESSTSGNIPDSDVATPSSVVVTASTIQLAQICSDISEIKTYLLSRAARDVAPSHSSSSSSSSSSNLTMDSTILLNSIQKIIAENQQMKSQLESKSDELQQINRRLLELIPSSHLGVSESSTAISSKTDNSSFAEEIQQLKAQLVESNAKVVRLQEKNYQLSMENLELDRKLLQKPPPETLTAESRNISRLLKQAFNQVYSSFVEQLPTILSDNNSNSDESTETIVNLLSSIMIEVRNSLSNSKDSQKSSSNSASSSSSSPNRINIDQTKDQENLPNDKEEQKQEEEL